jgi:cyclic dehypoxanthinyl futalosine synthase
VLYFCRRMQIADLYNKALDFGFLTIEEGMYLFEEAPLTDLMMMADELRRKQVPHGKVTWQIDRNVNTTNVCMANCKFCNFYRIPGHPEAYITDMPTYRQKIGKPFNMVAISYCFREGTIRNWD